MNAVTIGLDLANHNFHVHVVGSDGAVIKVGKLRRSEVISSSRLRAHALLVWRLAPQRIIGYAS